MLKKKNGQVKMTETIAVLFIFFILVFFGIVFYLKYSQISFKEKEHELLAGRAIETTLKTLFLPELLCSRGDAEPEDNCLDLMKLKYVNETFKDNMENYYFNIFSYGKVSVRQLYPLSKSNEWVLYDKNNFINGTPNPYEATYFIVSLRDETKSLAGADYGYGYLEVGVYS